MRIISNGDDSRVMPTYALLRNMTSMQKQQTTICVPSIPRLKCVTNPTNKLIIFTLIEQSVTILQNCQIHVFSRRHDAHFAPCLQNVYRFMRPDMLSFRQSFLLIYVSLVSYQLLLLK